MAARRVSWIVVAASLVACSGDPEDAGETVASAGSTETEETAEEDATVTSGVDTADGQGDDLLVPLGEVEARLREWFESYAPQASGPQDLSWQLAITPPLPLEWPPSEGTRWVRWVYARSVEAGLADAERVAYPWASVALTAGRDEAMLRLVTPVITAHPDPQGVGPLDADTAAALDDLTAVSAEAVDLTAEPDAATAARIQSAYAAWLATNGVIAGTLPDAHTAFWTFVAG